MRGPEPSLSAPLKNGIGLGADRPIRIGRSVRKIKALRRSGGGKQTGSSGVHAGGLFFTSAHAATMAGFPDPYL